MHLCDKALAATSEAMVITDAAHPDNPIIYANASFHKLLGAPSDQDTLHLPISPSDSVRAGQVVCPSRCKSCAPLPDQSAEWLPLPYTASGARCRSKVACLCSQLFRGIAQL